MAIRKLEDGRYLVDVRPTGVRGKRIRKKFVRRYDAQNYETHIMATMQDKDWISKPADLRTLPQLIDIWWQYHGCNHKHGDVYRQRLKKIDREMKHPRAYMLTRAFLMEYRSRRLQDGITPRTVNRDLVTLSGMFRVLIEAGQFHHDNPIHGLKKLKGVDKGMGFLSATDIATLLSSLDGDDKKIVIFCLSTGARWGEAKKLQVSHVTGNRAMFLETKNSKSRAVPISQELADLILPGKSGLVFDVNYTRIRETIKLAKPDLPRGQAFHVLRHTFATHFMMNGGNIITLQRILGHSDIKQTMVYAHFSPDYLADAIRFNPLKGGVSI